MYHIRYKYYLYCLKSVKDILRTCLRTFEADKESPYKKKKECTAI